MAPIFLLALFIECLQSLKFIIPTLKAQQSISLEFHRIEHSQIFLNHHRKSSIKHFSPRSFFEGSQACMKTIDCGASKTYFCQYAYQREWKPLQFLLFLTHHVQIMMIIPFDFIRLLIDKQGAVFRSHFCTTCSSHYIQNLYFLVCFSLYFDIIMRSSYAPSAIIVFYLCCNDEELFGSS